MMDSGGILTIGLSEAHVDEEFVRHYRNFHKGRYIKLDIEDTGHGMDNKTLQHIFEPFFTTRKIGKGTGLGLSVVHGIVKSNKGEIIVESEVGKGTQFHIYFPSDEIKISEEPVKRKIRKGNEHIFFIDDEESIVIMIKELLERLGYTVTIATNSQDALAKFRKHYTDFDLVITDQIMPDIKGEQLAGEFIRICPHIPVILITGFLEEISRDRLKKIGIRDCILKPVDTYTLSETIRKVLDN